MTNKQDTPWIGCVTVLSATIGTSAQPILQQLINQVQLLTQTMLVNQQAKETLPQQVSAPLHQIVASSLPHS
jgi:hypothetical protein